MRSILSINQLQLPVMLGTTQEEQVQAQIIALSIHLGFAQPPKACQSDTLSDTLPYDALCSGIKAFCKDRSFALIEALAQALYDHTHRWVAEHHTPCDRLWLCVSKQPPLSDVGHCEFALGDGHPQTWSS